MMKNSAKIMVLLASYQGEKYLREQLDSILNQSLSTERVKLQITISDDGSTDGTMDIIQEYCKKYPEQVWCMNLSKPGCSKARDTGTVPNEAENSQNDRKDHMGKAAANFFRLLTAAEGNYILLSDQDDVWKPDKVDKLLKKMKQMEREAALTMPILVYSDMEVVDENLNQISSSFSEYQHCNSNRRSLTEILVENPVTGGAVMMNTALLSLLRKTPEFCVMHDWWIALAASCFGRIGYVKESLYLYRQHDHNVLGAKKSGIPDMIKQRIRSEKQVQENYRRMMKQAECFLEYYGKQLSPDQKQILNEFIQLFYSTPLKRLKRIRQYHFYKSSGLQTLAMAVTIKRRDKE